MRAQIAVSLWLSGNNLQDLLLFPPWVVCDSGEQRAFTSTQPSRLPKALPSQAQASLLLDRFGRFSVIQYSIRYRAFSLNGVQLIKDHGEP